MKYNPTIEEILAEQFGAGGPVVIASAPGRVNLIGEHTDYNDGFVLPMAIEFKMQLAGRKRADRLVKIYSADYGEQVTFTLDEPLQFDVAHPWSNYLRGVCQMLLQKGAKLPGMELAFVGTIPQGAGLSSSAALEIVTALVLQELGDLRMGKMETVLLCQKAENDFVGMKCGMLDQFASMMGEKGHATFLDCRSMQFDHIPLHLGGYKILVCHSGVKHQLVDSEYNERRESCMAAVSAFQQKFPKVKALRDVDPEMLEQNRELLSPKVYRRCLHVVTENYRVQQSVAALRQGDLQKFGQLMDQSHDSQRDDYEVSCVEVDQLVDLARKVPGVLGARITGGGFGGCTVNLVTENAVVQFEKEVLPAYKKSTGIDARVFVCTPGPGARVEN